MIKTTPVQLPSCPAALQTAVRERLEQPDCELRSVTLTESTPYKDQNRISRQYRAIVDRWNLVTVLHCYADGPLSNQVSVNELIWGDILEVIRTAPACSALAMLRESAPEQTRTFLAI